jgi:hypothetical protein
MGENMSQHYDLITEIKNLPFNIKNILGWSKVLWNNFDWGGNFLLEIMEYKLKRMKRYMKVDTVILREDADKEVEEMQSCLDAIQHLISEDYEEEFINKYHEKYPIDWDNYLEQLNAPMSKEQHKDWEEMHENIDTLKKKYKHQLFDLLRDKYDWWGD